MDSSAHSQIAAAERKRSVEIFEEVSRLLDKRLYRLRLVYWSLPIGNSLGKRSELANQRMDDYRTVLYEWNDGINRNLALIQQYFGEDARHEFDNVIGIHFIELGRTVEDLWNGTVVLNPQQRTHFEEQLQLLSELVYYYNISLLELIRADSMAFVRGDVHIPGESRRNLLARRQDHRGLHAKESFQRPDHVEKAFRREVTSSNAPASPTYVPSRSTAGPPSSADDPERHDL
jgi:hypothetical protein